MRNKIYADLVAAMKQQDKERLSVLRIVKGAIQLEEINLKHELTDEETISVLAKQIKIRRESIAEFQKGNRTDLVESTEKEISILNEYMPEQLSEEEVIKVIDEAFATINPTSQKDMGKVMGYVTPKLKGRTDMSNVSQIIKSRLS